MESWNVTYFIDGFFEFWRDEVSSVVEHCASAVCRTHCCLESLSFFGYFIQFKLFLDRVFVLDIALFDQGADGVFAISDKHWDDFLCEADDLTAMAGFAYVEDAEFVFVIAVFLQKVVPCLSFEFFFELCPVPHEIDINASVREVRFEDDRIVHKCICLLHACFECVFFAKEYVWEHLWEVFEHLIFWCERKAPIGKQWVRARDDCRACAVFDA